MSITLVKLVVFPEIETKMHHSYFYFYLFIADVCHFQKLSEESSQEFDFQWNSEPESIGKMFFRLKNDVLCYVKNLLFFLHGSKLLFINTAFFSEASRLQIVAFDIQLVIL